MANRYKIGYTTGVFDMFHVGHLNIFERAKEQCDYLIVGVSTDELVEQYKNKRPVIPFAERIRIVSAIKCVDEVVPQIDMDKFAMWEKLHFDAMFHGDDWKNSAMYNNLIEQFDKVGVDIVFLPHTPNVSSTMLRSESLKKIED